MSLINVCPTKIAIFMYKTRIIAFPVAQDGYTLMKNGRMVMIFQLTIFFEKRHQIVTTDFEESFGMVLDSWVS